MKAVRFAGAMAALALLSACASRGERFDLAVTGFDRVEGWETTDAAPALSAFVRSCDKLEAAKSTSSARLSAAPGDWRLACAQARSTAPERSRAFFEANFVPYVVNEGEPNGLFTGYYEPLIHGSRVRDKRFRIPVYGLPPEVKGGAPYLSRRDIYAGALKGRGLEILWVDDRVDLFFAEIQGSTRVRLPDGSETRLAYAGKNNHPYVAIGKVLKNWGELEDVTMPGIRDWLRRNPHRAMELLEENPSYVFFREAPESEGPTGAQGVVVTEESSLAVDPKYIPYGLPVFLQTELPATEQTEEQPYRRLLIAQDTGGAIRGPVRGDIFFGAGVRAEALAGAMKGRGTYVLLVPKALAARL